MKNKIKVVWLCQVVNEQIKQYLDYGYPWLERKINSVLGRKTEVSIEDYARWNTNAINEMRNNPDIEFQVVSPFPYLRSEIQTYVEDGITFHFFQSEDYTFFTRLKYITNNQFRSSFDKNSRLIHRIIGDINPDLIHLMGAENPNYGKAILTLKTNAPIIVQLQTLMSMPNFKESYYISEQEYLERTDIEKKIILRADYVGTVATTYIEYLKSQKEFQNKVFLTTTLAVTETVQRVDYDKEYDIVYFAANINKAADVAIEVFAKVQKIIPSASIVFIGGYDDVFKAQLDEYIATNQLHNITFTGRLPKYEDVITTVQKAKVALLPLKVDLISGTIRESMTNGVPVVSTITPGTPLLNRLRESILLTEVGNTDGLSKHVINLLNDTMLYNTIRQNAYLTAEERDSNSKVVSDWIAAYKWCLNQKND